jgi:tetratricopeptide (TPR) repeat protein
MLRQFNRLLLLAILIAITLYITLTNSDSATIKLGPNISLTTYAGVIYMGVFFLGCVAASVVALFFGFKSYLRERKLRAAERSRQAFFDLFVKARCYMAAHEWGAARALWEQVLGREPENVIARVELSTCMEELGDLKEALRVLDETRAGNGRNVEVLFRAVRLNQKLGNNTAAHDNLGLIVAEAPTRRALETARDIAEGLGRFDDALEYHRQLESVGHISESMTEAKTRLGYAQLISSVESEGPLRDALKIFVRKHPSFIPALEKLASLELAHGHLEECAELLVKAAKLSPGDLTKWSAIIDLWLKTAPGDFQRRADRALAAARSTTQGTHGTKRIESEFIIAKTLLAINRPEDAHTLLEGLQSLAEKEGIKLSREHAQTRTHLIGLCLSRLGQARDTGSLWEALAEPSSQGSNSGKREALSDRGEPSPALSTP